MTHTALRVELDVDGKRQAILIGAQGTQVIRQALRQHGKHAIGKVHRRRAMAGLQVDMPVPGNIVRNVGDMHAQLIAALGRALERDGIVKVARINRVDGDDKTIAQVTTKRVFKRCGHIERKRLCLCQRRLGIAVGIAIACHNVLTPRSGASSPPMRRSRVTVPDSKRVG